MFHRLPGRSTRFHRVIGETRSRRRRSERRALVVESLESRELLAPLAWATGVTLPTAGGIVALPEGTSLLVLGEPATTSYNLTATDPSWQANVGTTVQPLDFARNSPGVGRLPNGYFVVFGGLQNGFATSAVTQYDPSTVTVVDGAHDNALAPIDERAAHRVRLGHGLKQPELRHRRPGQQRNVSGHDGGVQTDREYLDVPGFVAANVVRRVGRQRRRGPHLHLRRRRLAPPGPSPMLSIATPYPATPGIS